MSTSIISAQIWVGTSSQTIHEKVNNYLISQFCKHAYQEKNCNCYDCKNILNQSHDLIRWIKPLKGYLLSDIEEIYKQTTFMLEEDQLFFFILEKAHTLSGTCANKLLKMLEEPPRGYVFILITSNINLILPTIRSRCSVYVHNSSDKLSLNSSFLRFFLEQFSHNNVIQFEKELEQSKIDEHVSREYLAYLLNHFCQLQKHHILEKQSTFHYYDSIIKYIKASHSCLPGQGSASFFLETFFSTFPNA